VGEAGRVQLDRTGGGGNDSLKPGEVGTAGIDRRTSANEEGQTDFQASDKEGPL
jgi:hypothetical protein